MDPFSPPNAILQGGPAQDLPEHERILFVDESQHIVKVQRGNRYEHFQNLGQTVHRHSTLLRVFEWTRRTYVAE